MSTLSEPTSESTSHELPIGLIAGNGDFPIELVRGIKKKGRAVVAALHLDEADKSLEGEVDAHIWIRVGQLGKALEFFKTQKVEQVVFLGGIERKKLLKNFRPDLLGVKVLSQVRSVEDDKILRGVAREFESQGISVLDPASFLEGHKVQERQLTSRALTEEERADALLGWGAAKRIGELDIGQTVVVCEGMIVAVEAIEGTDRTIQRAGELAGSSPPVVVKLPKPQQDRRLDLPAIGPRTIEVMHQAGCSALVLEFEGALLLQESKIVELANSYGMAIMAFHSEEDIHKP